MDDLAYILGLMAENTDALGFIPGPTVESQYVANGRYIVQNSSKPVGYLLHGKPTPGGVLSIAQAVIEYDLRQRGHGQDVVSQLLDRARDANCRVIKLRCADDLQANAFWQSMGFALVNTLHPSNRRDRAINVYMLDLWPRLF